LFFFWPDVTFFPYQRSNPFGVNFRIFYRHDNPTKSE
jgi:hypothetical protein